MPDALAGVEGGSLNILLAEDDAAQCDAFKRIMQKSGHHISCVNRGESAVHFLKNNEVDLVVLDWQLPGMTGFEVLRWIRFHLGRELAVLFLSSRVLEVDLVQALDAGADDYVIKPFRSSELEARIRVLLRRREHVETNENAITVGPYLLDVAQRTISLHGKTIDSLTTKEFDVLVCLFRNAGRVISKDVLTRLAWGRELDSTSRTVDTHIYRLRQKLCLRPENGVRLNTLYTHGYRLEEVDSDAAKDGVSVPVLAP
jgi:DNA-binding response OmpR family regulator